jgi:hypothetical protein
VTTPNPKPLTIDALNRIIHRIWTNEKVRNIGRQYLNTKNFPPNRACAFKIMAESMIEASGLIEDEFTAQDWAFLNDKMTEYLEKEYYYSIPG